MRQSSSLGKNETDVVPHPACSQEAPQAQPPPPPARLRDTGCPSKLSWAKRRKEQQARLPHLPLTVRKILKHYMTLVALCVPSTWKDEAYCLYSGRFNAQGASAPSWIRSCLTP